MLKGNKDAALRSTMPIVISQLSYIAQRDMPRPLFSVVLSGGICRSFATPVLMYMAVSLVVIHKSLDARRSPSFPIALIP